MSETSGPTTEEMSLPGQEAQESSVILLDELDRDPVWIQGEGVFGKIEMRESVVLKDLAARGSPTVRLYRGVSQETVGSQSSYAARLAGVEDGEALNLLKAKAAELAQNPCYETLKNYGQVVRGMLMDKREWAEFDREYGQVEQGLLDGYSVRSCLKSVQIKFNGGFMERSIAPYLAASMNAVEALDYAGRRADSKVLVFDVPAEMVEFFDGTEVAIKEVAQGDLLEYVVGILHRLPERNDDNLREIEDLSQSIATLDTLDECRRYSPIEAEALAQRSWEERKQIDEVQASIDVELLRRDKVEYVRSLPWVRAEMDGELDGLLRPEAEGDIYSQALSMIYDHYRQRLKEIGLKDELEHYEYQSAIDARVRKFSPDEVSLDMLNGLRVFYQRQVWRLNR